MKLVKHNILFRFRNAFIYFGPRVRSNKLFLEFMYKVKLLSNLSPLYVLEEALENVRPAFELRTKKVAATKYNIPFLLTAERADSFAIRKLIKNGLARSTERKISDKIAYEVVEAFNFRGPSYKQLLELNEEVNKSRTFLKFLRRR